MQSVAQSWLVYRISGSEMALGVVASCAYVPVLLFAPAAGVIVDHVRKRELILATQSISMLLAFGLGALAWTGHVSVPIIAAFAVCLGAVGAFDLPARQAFLVEMVGADDLPSAIALNASIFNVARVVGPAIAGSLVGVIGEGPCFILNGASYLAVLWALAGVPKSRKPLAGRRRGDMLGPGLRYVRARPELAALLLALGVVSGMALQANVIMPAFAERVFGVGATGYGMLLTAYGIGAVLAALRLASRHWTRLQHRRHLLGGLVVCAVGLAAVAASPTFAAALALQAVAGLGMLHYTATTNTVIQLLVDDAFRGRVMGLHTVMFMGTSPLGSLLLGGIAQAAGPRAAIAVAGVAPAVAALVLRRRIEAVEHFPRVGEAVISD
jgi:MFS family permease